MEGSGKTRYMQIGEVAQRTGLTQRTIRYYEERGLLRPPTRMEGGFRLYSEEDVQRLEQIKQLTQLLGFSLNEIRQILDAAEVKSQLRADWDKIDPSERRKRLLHAIEASESQIRLIDHKIEQLGQLRARWAERLERYRALLLELDEVESAAT